MSIASSMHLIFVLSYSCFVSCNEFSGNTTLTANLLLISALMVPNLHGNYFHHFNFGDKFQVIAFSDEEGVGFQSTFLGRAAIAGQLPASALRASDEK